MTSGLHIKTYIQAHMFAHTYALKKKEKTVNEGEEKKIIRKEKDFRQITDTT